MTLFFYCNQYDTKIKLLISKRSKSRVKRKRTKGAHREHTVKERQGTHKEKTYTQREESSIHREKSGTHQEDILTERDKPRERDRVCGKGKGNVCYYDAAKER